MTRSACRPSSSPCRSSASLPLRGDLSRELVMAARRDDDRLRAEPHTGGDRLVGGGVARVQGDEQVDRRITRIVDDRRRLERRLVVAEALRDTREPSRSRPRCVEPGELDAPPDLSPVRDERKAHVRLAAPGVDDTDDGRAPRAAAAGAARRSAGPAAPCHARSPVARNSGWSAGSGWLRARSCSPVGRARRRRLARATRATRPSSSAARARRRRA